MHKVPGQVESGAGGKFSLMHSLNHLDRKSAVGWLVLRLCLAGLLAAHGWARLITDGVVPFGAWLESQGIPGGFYVAFAITSLEILATPVLALGLVVFPLSIAFSAIYAVGILLVHLPAGWFVVGLGRNGVEYSVLLITCLLLVGWQHKKARSGWLGPS